MSFDIFLQAFDGGSLLDTAAILEELAPYLKPNLETLRTDDGEADVYGLDNDPIRHLMFNHVGGRIAWDIIFSLAQRCGWVIMPVDCPICLTHRDQLSSVPTELLDEFPVVVVRSGSELLAVILDS